MKEFRIKSSDGVSNLACYIWDDVEGSPKAVLQIIHGMCEYVMRYDAFAKYLNSQGILVVGDDHIGHGKSVEKPEDLGYFGPRDGWLHLVQDEHLLRKTMQADYPDVPYIMLGHSFGSFIIRAYLALQSTKGLSGAIVMGTAGHNGALAAGHKLCKLLRKTEGERTRSKLITAMAFGSYTKRIKNPVNTWAWLSTDDEICIKAHNDPMHNWMFTLAGYDDMFSILEFVGGDACMKAYDKELPILLVSGWEDPVGNYGKGPAEIAERLENLGCNINMVLYEGMRHEVLNEIGKEAVWEDMRDYILDMADGNCTKDESKDFKVFAGM
ncbi:MAG: alpha/beta fold hydrolase [Firmicutes bacterium]|nr:alpha/beta fold hydrolase [Bacillota bacterium]